MERVNRGEAADREDGGRQNKITIDEEAWIRIENVK